MNLNLQNFSTLRIGGMAYRVLNLRSESDIISAVSYARTCGKPLIVLGEGSNSVFSDEAEKFVIGHMQMKGINIKEETEECAIVRVAAGESWDGFVEWSIEQGFSGIETLSGIPGTVGAAPIQNIGAYGTELSDVLVSVAAYDIQGERFRAIQAKDCELAYRESVFKKNPSKHIISEITVRLSKSAPAIPEYASIKDKFVGTAPSLQEIRDVVLETRHSKLPDYRKIPNCGSFFKNPVISKEQFSKIQETYPNIPSFETESGQVKLFAGWLIEHADPESLVSKNLSLYEKSKLVLINTGDATFEELLELVGKIKTRIQDQFGIELEHEPNLFA